MRLRAVAAPSFAACAATALALAAPCAGAQSRFGSDSLDLYAPASMYAPASSSHFARQPEVPPLRSTLDPASSLSAHWLSSSVELDRPRAAANGTYTRPKLMVGLPSTQMRGLLRAAGVEAERCQLPMLRARTSMATGDLNGTLWLYARCSFH